MKCANPGCANHRTHIHHMQKWAVYETNNQKHMIAICPTCHHEVHHGKLAIDDDTLYQWKKIERAPSNIGQLYVKPSISSKLLLGNIAVIGDTDLIIFELFTSNKLSIGLYSSLSARLSSNIVFFTFFTLYAQNIPQSSVMSATLFITVALSGIAFSVILLNKKNNHSIIRPVVISFNVFADGMPEFSIRSLLGFTCGKRGIAIK